MVEAVPWLQSGHKTYAFQKPLFVLDLGEGGTGATRRGEGGEGDRGWSRMVMLAEVVRAMKCH